MNFFRSLLYLSLPSYATFSIVPTTTSRSRRVVRVEIVPPLIDEQILRPYVGGKAAAERAMKAPTPEKQIIAFNEIRCRRYLCWVYRRKALEPFVHFDGIKRSRRYDTDDGDGRRGERNARAV